MLKGDENVAITFLLFENSKNRRLQPKQKPGDPPHNQIKVKCVINI